MPTSTDKRIQVKIDSNLKTNVDNVLNDLGLSQTTLITALYKRINASGGIPFDLQLTEREKANARLSQETSALPTEE